MILASQINEFLTIAIVAVFIIAIALVVYYIVTGKKSKEEVKISPNFETNNFNGQVVQPAPQEIATVPQEPVKFPEVREIMEAEQAKPIEMEEMHSEPTISEEQKAAEEAKTDNSIQTLLNQMQQDLNKANTESYTDSLTRYEDDEEANAIISYKELMKYKESNEKNIVLEDKSKEEIKKTIKEKENKKEDSKEEVKRFKRSEFISPIFGYNEDTNVTYREIKRPPRKEKVVTNEWESDRMLKNLEDDAAEVIEFEEKKEEVKEISKSDKFLDELVDFRNKLN